MLLDKKTDIKIKHGVTGLLKNLAQAPANRTPLGDAGILDALAGSTIWDRKWDIAETVQLSAIGISKHLCQSNGTSLHVILLMGLTNAASFQLPQGDPIRIRSSQRTRLHPHARSPLRHRSCEERRHSCARQRDQITTWLRCSLHLGIGKEGSHLASDQWSISNCSVRTR